MNAKTEVAKTAPAGGAVASVKKNMPAYLQEIKQTGAGVSADAHDILIPGARILQKTSKEVEEGTADFVKGAKVGAIYIKAVNMMIDGEQGIIFQPCFLVNRVVERTPVDSNSPNPVYIVHVALHPKEIAGAEEVTDPKSDKKTWMIKAKGTELIETRYVSGFMIQPNGAAMPLVLTFQSTGHQVAKGWELAQGLVRDNKGDVADKWAIYWKLTTRMRARGQQTWYVFEVNHAGEVDPATGLPDPLWAPTADDYNRGKRLYEDLTAGNVAFDTNTTDDNNSNGGVKNQSGKM